MEVEQSQVFPRLLTVEDVAEILCVPLSTVHHWAVRGEGPPSFKVGKHRRFDAAVVAAWLAKQQQDVA
ncbi:helix-turn-helix domain-containing protein [Phycicoccus sp. Soil748]|uniref:helix-turn-helix domain-containing protein n=1 Tax=Phycicoccus sp. Soil748 TaxID=1736397 RepID=UPI0007037FCF|nr:helix-turn-helix domain-containing protein [Phycicoccus sp. Soil748]KRE56415.1 hypothetical protein ASG70_04670 [Phycicoccus sp. Soil748]